ncbi:response regulator [Rubrivivax benzoatilyticus]|uniref:Response regulator n=1 Tax=Rubrivivax benzoatilyticus TaxID=316997 RepID=A0ABX0HZM3_9BURK|nr:response regulator [Rubrivivax benzoatilyticus]NHK99865.1 response regulator [Rubrivivax benzoatilyticus]NHL25856.1 response regulator [Rubrivivax benzoatilyticus]
MASKGRILVVDDDRLVLAAVTHGLAQAGYEVVDADNGDEAILKARQLRPEIALLDIRMEGKSGFDVAEYLRDVARIPFMFLSAFADEATIAKVHELGAVAYLIKPLDIDQILPTVDDAFARLRAGQLAPPPAVAPVVAAAAPAPEPLSDPLPLAVGVLMHRHSLSRQAARQRLQRMAAEQGIAETAQAERLVAAVEELARSS